MSVRRHRSVSRWVGLLAVFAGVLTACSTAVQAGPSPARLTVLTCQDSFGQGRTDPAARWVGGVGSPALYGGFPGEIPRQRSEDGHTYLAWKDPVAVAPSARPFRTITVVSPPSARLLFATPARWATLWGTVLPVLARAVRLSACGRGYASYFGAVMVRHWACVRLAVTGPAGRLGTVNVPVGVAQC
jgi:hypothetical protein